MGAYIYITMFEVRHVLPQRPAACGYIPAYLAIDMIGTSSVIAMSYDAGPYGSI